MFVMLIIIFYFIVLHSKVSKSKDYAIKVYNTCCILLLIFYYRNNTVLGKNSNTTE